MTVHNESPSPPRPQLVPLFISLMEKHGWESKEGSNGWFLVKRTRGQFTDVRTLDIPDLIHINRAGFVNVILPDKEEGFDVQSSE